VLVSESLLHPVRRHAVTTHPAQMVRHIIGSLKLESRWIDLDDCYIGNFA
jgi:hypothetical protein